jgi:hypothetical protein
MRLALLTLLLFALTGCTNAIITLNVGSASKQAISPVMTPEVQCAALLGPKITYMDKAELASAEEVCVELVKQGIIEPHQRGKP